ncbi:LexA family protein [Thiobacter aerophilum]|uniref:S24 family peptidase n=1 Tax=Thiobacter aerophilum TaxID=3121275 RepID=A0ABV0EET5_9BURK
MADDADYLAKLQDFYARHRVLPAYSTMGELLGLRSKSSVAALVGRLKLAGYLETAPDRRLKPTARFFERPRVDGVRAGRPHPAGEGGSEALTLDEYLIERPSRTVLIPVKGDSMIDAGIRDGDIVVVERKPTAEVGDIVVAVVDNEFTLKYLDKDRQGFLLRAANPAYAPIRPAGSLEIYGVVVGLVRKYR